MNLLAAVALVGVLVFIHEFGHFVVAKACGVEVHVFSFGFGRRLFGVRLGATDYRVSALPFGGYVRMAGADAFGTGEQEDDEEIQDPARSFLRRPVWQRLLVVAAGPAFNLALPFVVFTVLLMAGEPRPAPVVGSVNLSTPAWEAGVQPGDVVKSVDGVPVIDWLDVSRQLSLVTGGQVHLDLERDGQPLDLVLTASAGGDVGDLGMSRLRPAAVVGVDDPRSPAGAAGLHSGDVLVAVGDREVVDWNEVELNLADAGSSVEVEVKGEDGHRKVTLTRDGSWLPLAAGRPLMASEPWGLVPSTLIVGTVSTSVGDQAGFLSGCRPEPSEPPPSPAQVAGIQQGDRFLRLDGRPIQTWSDVLSAVRATMVGVEDQATARPLVAEMVREGVLVRLDLTPQVIQDVDDYGRYYYRPIIGVQGMGTLVGGPEVRRYYAFGEAFLRSSEETLELGGLIVEQIGKLLTGEAAVDQSVGGPIEMVRQASMAAEQGIFAWARLLGILSISLGIVNLLPVPVLDGGQLMFYGVEAVRGRPVSVVLRERAQQIGVLFLVLLMLTVLVIDINRVVQDLGQ